MKALLQRVSTGDPNHFSAADFLAALEDPKTKEQGFPLEELRGRTQSAWQRRGVCRHQRYGPRRDQRYAGRC
jgi:hypothetical protein